MNFRKKTVKYQITKGTVSIDQYQSVVFCIRWIVQKDLEDLDKMIPLKGNGVGAM